MKHITSTLFNSFEDYADSATQLHIYAFETEDEYTKAEDAIELHTKTDYLSELGYHDDPVPCEPIPGLRYSSYDMQIVGDFLVVIETIIIDV